MSNLPVPAARHQGAEYWVDRIIEAAGPNSDAHDFLKDAQKSAKTGIRNTLIKKRPHRFLVDMPTQSGKTPLYIRLLQLLADSGPMPRVLVIAPYRRLVNQLRAEFVKFGKTYPEGHPLSDIGVWHMFEKKLEQITATTWPSAMSLVHNKTIDPTDVDIVFVDEAHLAQTDRRRALLRQFSNAVIGDFTATPAYNEDKTLEKDSVLAFRMTVDEAVEKHVISQFREILLEEDPIDFSGVPLVGDDYDKQITASLVNTEERTQGWIKFYRDWVDPLTGQRMFGKKGYINTVTVARAERLEQAFNDQLGAMAPEGVTVAAAIHSFMSPTKQKDIFDRFAGGKILLLVQIRLAGLGLSRPEAQLCINDAPSLSPVEVGQRAGRVVAIDENNPDKCAYIVERPDYGRGTKQPLLYGEVVGAGVGYKRTQSNSDSPQVLARENEALNVVSDPQAVAAFMRDRIQDRKQATLEAKFLCAYPRLTKFALLRKYKSSGQLWQKVEAEHRKLFPELEKPKEKDFRDILRGYLNPWDNRDVFNHYRPMALAISKALGVHASKLFGSSEELAERFPRKRKLSIPTPQRAHIHELLGKAHNPLTGKIGISVQALGELMAQPDVLKYSSRIFDGRTRQRDDQGYYSPFDLATGTATDLAVDIAAILDMPVEEVFKYDAALACENAAKADSWWVSHIPGAAMPLSLPLDHCEPLKAALSLKETNEPAELKIEKAIFEDELRDALRLYFAHLSMKTERVIRSRFGINLPDEMTLDEIGPFLGVTRERIRQYEQRGLRIMHGMDVSILQQETDPAPDLDQFSETPDEQPPTGRRVKSLSRMLYSLK